MPSKVHVRIRGRQKLDQFPFRKIPNMIPEAQWRRQKAEHVAGLRSWVEDRVSRSERGIKHPVWDFLFEYYSFRPGHLLRWSPGVGVELEGATTQEMDWPQFVSSSNGVVIPVESLPSHRKDYLDWAVIHLATVAEREPLFGCFGLHEWAMVYQTSEVRHRVPLRLSPAKTDEVIQNSVLRCTHYDAYRFFSPTAAPLNRTNLTRQNTTEQDQPGCVHANMDLYKFAYKLAPFVSAETLAQAFLVAVAARELDMRASPYQLNNLGFAAIEIETREGREEYIHEQRAIALQAAPVRLRLLTEYQRIRNGLLQRGI